MITSPSHKQVQPQAKPASAPSALTHVRDAHPGPRARGEGLLRRLDDLFDRLDTLIHRAVPQHLNPMTHSGAIANTTFLIAVVSGILLLIWYSPSVHQAYASLETVRSDSWLGQLVRSLHRYSSDACMFFILLHAFRIVTARRIFGARWLAWITGTVLLGIMWFLGWTGYWLVWDVRAQHVAEGTARFLDFLPVFGQPLASSFLTNDGVPSLLFFLVFFTHMLLPLAIGIGLWLHLSRVSRPKIITNRPLTLWIVATLTILSIGLPATSASQADMASISDGFTMDWWYLWPLMLTDRLSGGALWALSLFATTAFVSVPWWMKRRNSPAIAHAVVDLDACHGCTLCAQDCPFDAITMVERGDNSRIPVQAQVDLSKCVGCGICTGACDSDAISIPWLDIKSVKAELDQWVEETVKREDKPMLAFLCSSSAASAFSVDSQTGHCPELPGYRVKAVPCAGWVSPRLIEHCVQKGAAGILVSGCGPGEQVFREGSQWLTDRLSAKRRPILRKSKADPQKVRFVQFDRTRPEALQNAAQEFRSGRMTREKRKSRLTGAAAGTAIAGVLALGVALGSDLPYSAAGKEPALVISFRHPGALIEEVQELTPEEAERLPVHMRKAVATDRSRAPVRMQVFAGDELLVDESYPPRGFRADGPSIALESIPLEEGVHSVSVQIADTPDPEEWNHKWSGNVEISSDSRRILFFEGSDGFHLE